MARDSKKSRKSARAKKKRWLGSLIIVLVLLVFISTGFWYVVPQVWNFLRQQETFKLQKVEFVNCEHLNLNELEALLPEVEGVNLFVIDLQKIETCLSQHPWVEAVTIKRRLPDRLSISIVEREPVALINSTPLLAVDISGLLLPLKNWHGILDLPLILERQRGRLRQGEILSSPKTVQALRHLERMRHQIPEVWQLISEVTWNRTGELVFHSSASRTRIVLGSRPNWQQVLNFYSFLIYEGGQSGIEDIELIDLRFQGQVVIRRKNESS